MPTILDDLRRYVHGAMSGEEYDAFVERAAALVDAYDALIALPPWSKEPPTTPGVYRFRSDSNPDTAEWVEVEEYSHGDNTLVAYLFGDALPLYLHELRGRWQKVEIADD